MLELELGGLSEILLLGAHCDDIEIGCGATVCSLLQERDDVKLKWVVFSSNEVRRKEAEAAAADFAKGAEIDLEILEFRNGYFPYVGAEIKDYFEYLKNSVSPDLIFTHHGADLHQDHRLISELTWNTFRDHTILEYEIPKYDAGLGSPNVFFPITPEVLERKVSLLEEHFKSQQSRQWFDRGTFSALLRLRGVEANAPDLLAEAFYGRKMTIAV